MRDYGEYSGEKGIIESFEEFEEEQGVSFGEEQEDVLPWYTCFRAGFIAGGNK